MSTAKHVGRIGALAVALGIGNVRRNATRVTVSIGAAALVVTAAAAAPVSTESPAVKLSADSTALLLCGTTCPTWNDAHVEDIKNQFVAPTHPGQDIDYVAVTTPSGGVAPHRSSFALWDFLASGSRAASDLVETVGRIIRCGNSPGCSTSPTISRSRPGVADLEAAMAAAGNDHLVIYGDHQGANVANVEKRKLAEQYPDGTAAPDIDFVLTGDCERAQWRSSCPVSRLLCPNRVDLRRPRADRHPVPTPTSSFGSTTGSPISRCIRSTPSPP